MIAEGLVRTLYIAAYSTWGIALAVHDFREHRLPDALTLSAFPVIGVAVAATRPENLGMAAGLALVALAAGFLGHRVADLGLGDVKLAGAVTLAAGLTANPGATAATAMFATAVMGGIHALIHLAVTRDRAAYIPFGPAILFGGFAGIVGAA